MDLAFRGAAPPGVAPLVLDLAARLRGRTPVPAAGDDGYDRDDDDDDLRYRPAGDGAGQESEIPNFKGSYLGRFSLVSADFWTSDHLSERS